MKAKLLLGFIVAFCAISNFIIFSEKTNAHSSSINNSNMPAPLNNNSVGNDTTANRPPDYWNYVPDRFITCKVSKLDVYCTRNGVVFVSGKAIRGNFIKGKNYEILLETKSCDGKQKGAWCDQRQTGTRLVKFDPKLKEKRRRNNLTYL